GGRSVGRCRGGAGPGGRGGSDHDHDARLLRDPPELSVHGPGGHPGRVPPAGPDVAPRQEPRDPFALERMRLLNEAYEVLSDPRKRREYDARMRASTPDQGASTDSPHPPAQAGQNRVSRGGSLLEEAGPAGAVERETERAAPQTPTQAPPAGGGERPS